MTAKILKISAYIVIINTKMNIKFLLIILAFLSPPSFGADGDEALFGLRWGMTVAEVKSAGTALTKAYRDRNMESYKAPSMPKNISDFESYSLIFADGKLTKMYGIGKTISNDPSGLSGKERFETLRSVLIQKYGQPILNSQIMSNKLFKEHDEFYLCLKYSGCGIWVSVFETPDKLLTIEMKGLARGAGFIEIAAEARPQWSQAMDVYKLRKNLSDKDAL